jgi:esterase/lipase superfamily enzyme
MTARVDPKPCWFRPLLALGVVLFLAGCAARAALVVAPEAEGIGANERILVASTRVFEDGQLTSDRLEGLSFGSFDVSVPPDRDPGSVDPVTRERFDPREEFFVTEADIFDGPEQFRSALRAELAAQPADERDIMLFVHGFNTTFADGLYRTAQIRHDLRVPGVAIHYAWPSAGHPLGYAYDRDSALFGRDGLEQLLIEIAASGSRDIVLIAHSMGSAVTMEALRQLRIGGRQDVLDRLSGVILMSPDIDIDVFRSQALRIDPLPQPFLIFTSRRDRALLLSARITGLRNRLGNIGQVEDVADLDVTLVDLSEFSGGSGDRLNHFPAATSPAFVELLRQVGSVNAALAGADGQQIDLLQGTILTVRNATQVVLHPSAPR